MLESRKALWSWTCVALALLWLGAASRAQQAGRGGTGKADAQAEAAEEPAAPAPSAGAVATSDELGLWAEPNRDALLRNEFREVSGPVLTEAERSAVREMSIGRAPLDKVVLRRYIAETAAGLSRRANIAALLTPESGARVPARSAFDEASNRLLQPLLEPATAGNAAFRRAYLEELLAVAPNLLKGHLFTRTAVMTALVRAAGPQASPELFHLFVAQLADPEQAYTVKLLAAQGVTQFAARGRQPLDPNAQAIPAARALAAFLVETPELPWPIQVRCLEALGALRQATDNPLNPASEIAAVPFAILADPEAAPHARAWAGWALSRMNNPSQGRGLNFDVVAYELGRVAAVLGQRIVDVPLVEGSPTRNLRFVARWTQPLLRILDAFVGEAEIRASGLNALAGGGSALQRGIEQRIRALATAGIQYGEAVGVQVAPARQAVLDALSELKAFLARNVPRSAEFYPGGPAADLPSVESAPGGGATKGATPAPKRGAGGR